VSIMSGAHMTLFPAILDLLEEKGAEDIRVFGGGIIPDEDMPALAKLGVAKIFTPGATTESIIAWVRENIGPRKES
jgi:methylmalonyl-CoA mutase, C-terminal domain